MIIQCSDGITVCNVTNLPVEEYEICYEYLDCQGFPCDIVGCSKQPIIDVDTCVEDKCWSSEVPIPTPKTNSIAAIITGTLLACLIVIILCLVVARKKLAVVYRRLVNNDEDINPPIGPEDLLAEINQYLDGTSNIYNPTTTHRGLLPPLGFIAPNDYYSTLSNQSDDEVSLEQEETSNQPEMIWDESMGIIDLGRDEE